MADYCVYFVDFFLPHYFLFSNTKVARRDFKDLQQLYVIKNWVDFHDHYIQCTRHSFIYLQQVSFDKGSKYNIDLYYLKAS